MGGSESNETDNYSIGSPGKGGAYLNEEVEKWSRFWETLSSGFQKE